jgi:hypothetical protein
MDTSVGVADGAASDGAGPAVGSEEVGAEAVEPADRRDAVVACGVLIGVACSLS